MDWVSAILGRGVKKKQPDPAIGDNNDHQETTYPKWDDPPGTLEVLTFDL